MSKENNLLSPTMFIQMVNECEAKALAIWNGEYEYPESESLLLGKFVDSLSQGKMKEFLEHNPECMTIRDKKLKAKFQKAYDDFDNVMTKDKVFASYLKGEMQKELKGVINGLDFHGYPDFITDDKIVDLKYLSNLEMVKGTPLPIARFYHWQLHLYRELAYQLDGKYRDCYLAVVTKETPYDHDIIHISDSLLAQASEDISKCSPRVEALIKGLVEAERCGKCDYCKSTKLITEPIDAELVGLNASELMNFR